MYYLHFVIVTVLFDTALMKVAKNDNDDVLYPCKNDEICQSDMPGSKCVKNTCVCMLPGGCENMQDDDSIVVRKIGLTCRGNSDCLIDNSFCHMKGNATGKCQCIDNTVVSGDGKNCLILSMGLNIACQEDQQCYIAGSECRKGFCKCKKGMRTHLGSCFDTKVLGDSCENDRECRAIQNSKCSNKECVCMDNYVMGGMGCLIAAKHFHAPCLEDVQCSWNFGSHSVCSENNCVCRECYYFQPETQKCVQHSIMLSQNCTENEECFKENNADSEYLACVTNVCQCKSPYVEVDHECVAVGSGTKFVLSIVLLCFVFLCF